jgi:hypothetical protein
MHIKKAFRPQASSGRVVNHRRASTSMENIPHFSRDKNTSLQLKCRNKYLTA